MSRVGRHFSLITISAGLVATSVSSFGAVPSHAAPSRQSVPAHPIDPPNTNPKHTKQRIQTVDRLYEEVMRSSRCSPTASYAAITGRC